MLTTKYHYYSYQPKPSNNVAVRVQDEYKDMYPYPYIRERIDFDYAYIDIGYGGGILDPLVRTSNFRPVYIPHRFETQYDPHGDHRDQALMAFIKRFGRLPRTGNEHCILIEDPNRPNRYCRLMVLDAAGYIDFIQEHTRSGQAFYAGCTRPQIHDWIYVFEDDGVHAHLESGKRSR